MTICNRFHARRANSGKITTFNRVPLFDAHVHRPPRPRGPQLGLLKSTLNSDNFINAVLIYLQPLRPNSLLKCVLQPEECKKITKPPHFGGSMSSKVINVNTPKKLVTTACYDKQHVCVCVTVFTLDNPISVK